MNKRIARSRTRGSPRWREKTMMITCSSTLDITLHESLYHPQHPWVGILHQTNEKNVLQRNWMKSVWRAISRLWGTPERDSCMQIRRRQLGGESPVHSRSVVKISYNIKMTTQKIRSHDDRRSTTWICYSSPTMICSIVHIYKKPSHCSRLQYKHYIIHDEVQKGENDFFNTYLHRCADKHTFW